jgi:hypothetical protein
MIPRNTSKTIRTHRNIRTLRSLPTRVGPARGHWSRLRETETLVQQQPPEAAAIPPQAAIPPRHSVQ